MLIVTARDAEGRAVRKASVTASGAGARARRRTGRKGIVRMRFRPRRRGTITIRVQRRGFKDGFARVARRDGGGYDEPPAGRTHRWASRAGERCTIADRLLTRLRGLLGRAELPSGEGLLLRPAPSIHTCFMRFAIDAVFLDDRLRVLSISPDLRPCRFAGRRGARAVLELAAGEARRRGIREGAVLMLVDGAPGAGEARRGAGDRDEADEVGSRS